VASIVNLHAKPGAGAELTLWRVGQTNTDTVVDLTTDPVLAGATATAFTDASGDDQGRVDISIPTDAAAGAYQWTAEIDSVVVWEGTIYIAPHGRPTSFLAHSIDIRSLTTPAWIIDRPEDVEGEAVGGGPAEQLIETGGPTTLDMGAVADGEYLQRVGDQIVGATPSGSGDVTAAAAFAANNRLITSDGTGKGVKASSVTVNGAAVSGVSTLAMTGALTGATAITTTDLTATGTITGISAADVGADATGTAAAAITAHEAAANPHPVYQLLSEKGDPNGYASLDGDGLLAEPATMVVESSGPTILTFGAIADGQFVKRVGDDLVGDNPAGSGDVTGPAGATLDSVPTLDATGKVLAETPVLIDSASGDMSGVGDLSMGGALTGATAITTTDLTATGTITGISAADVGADASGTAAAAIVTHVGLADPHTQYQKESEKGAALGYPSLDADQFVVEPALGVTDGTSTFTFGALVDTQVLYLDGTTIKSKVAAGGGDVTGPAGATLESVPTLDATGKVLVESPVTIDTATGDMAGVGDLTMAGDLSGAALISATAATFTDLTATGTITGISAADVGADATGTAAAAIVTHVALADPHTGYQLESEKDQINGYAGLDGSGFMVAPVTTLRATGQTLTMGATTDAQMFVRSGTTITTQAIPATVAAHTVGNAVPTGGSNGDVYERVSTGDYWAKSAGVWARNLLFSSIPGMSGTVFEVAARYNSGTLTNSGGAAASTVTGSATGVTYATSNARTSHVRVAFNGATTANAASSGIITPQQGIVHVGSTGRHGRFQLKFRFGLASVVQSNFRFFAGVITTAGTFSDDPTGASSVLGDRIGLAVDANTSLAAKWLVNYSGANQNNTAAYTLVQDNWYELVIWTAPLSDVIHMELWEQTTANGSLGSAPVASIDFAVTSDIVDIALRPFLAAANAGTAAASCNVHFGGLIGRCLFTA
jgi:hypothetical protein